uniref:Heat shock factor-binding protein 1 n=1 Tax=Salmo trutta TaxID=8032 RepID=A0A674C295_SALTR
MSEIQDPKSVQDLTGVVQTLLQQMQDKFQTMSDQIIGRNILPSQFQCYQRQTFRMTQFYVTI